MRPRPEPVAVGGTPPAGPLDAYDETRPEWWKDVPHIALLVTCRPCRLVVAKLRRRNPGPAGGFPGLTSAVPLSLSRYTAAIPASAFTRPCVRNISGIVSVAFQILCL